MKSHLERVRLSNARERSAVDAGRSEEQRKKVVI
jgi:hypothetical protein